MRTVALSTHHFPFHEIAECILNIVKRAGFDEIEIWGMAPHFDYRNKAEVKRIGELLKRAWLNISSIHLPFYMKVDRDPNKRGRFYISDSNEERRKTAVNEVLKCMEAGEYLGVDVAVLHTGMEFQDSTYDALRKSLEEILEIAERRKMKVAIENGFRPRTGIRDVYAVMKEFDSPYLGLCLDVGHLNIEGEWEFLKKIPNEKIFELHIVDNNGKEDEHLPPYEGSVRWEALYDLVRNSSAKLVLETGPVYDDNELRKSIILSGKRAGNFLSAVRLSKEEYIYMKRRCEFLLFEGERVLMEKFLPMKGDASIRSYFRLYGENGKSYVVMRIPLGAGEEEKVETQRSYYMLNSYRDVYSYLHRNGVSVPEVYFEDNGFFLMRDEGDWILEDYYLLGSGELKTFYDKAINLLINIQTINDRNCIAFSRRFGIETLKWEIDHFIEYGVESLGFTVRDEVKDELYALCHAVSRIPYLFCHRDYHSKNIIIKGGELVIVDFQDALLAPPHYDLASLIYDSYTELDEEFTEYLVENYFNVAIEKRVIDEGIEDFRKNLLMNALHRNLKAFGRFIYIYKEKNNPYHLRYLVSTIKKAISNARRLNLKSTIFLLELIYEHLYEEGFPYQRFNPLSG